MKKISFRKFVKKRQSDEKEKVDEVYEFFAYSKSGVRKRAYEGALREAQKEQAVILQKAELMK